MHLVMLPEPQGWDLSTRNDLPMDEDGRLAYPVSWAACVVLMERRDTSAVRMLPSCCPEGVIKRHLQNWKLYSVFLNTFMGMCCGTCSCPHCRIDHWHRPWRYHHSCHVIAEWNTMIALDVGKSI